MITTHKSRPPPKKKKQPTPVDKENGTENKIRGETETELPIVDETRGSVY